MRSEHEVRRLWYALRRDIYARYGCDVAAEFHSEWIELVKERLRTHPQDHTVLEAAEFDVTLCCGMVAAVNNAPLFTTVVQLWHDHARRYAKQHPQLDNISAANLSRLGYGMLRGWRLHHAAPEPMPGHPDDGLPTGVGRFQ